MRGLTALAATTVLLAACGEREEAATPAVAPVAASLAETSVVLSARPEQREFRDWRAACDNGAACFAFAPSTEPDAGWLRLSLAPETDAAPDVMIGLWSPGAEGLSPTAPLVLTIDGERFTTQRVEDADQPIGRVAAADAVKVVRALAAGRGAAISAGSQTVALSLTGASAAMLTGVVKAAFHAAQAEAFAPFAVVRRIAAGLRPFDPARFVTALCVRVTLDPADIVWGRGRRPVLLPPTGLIVSPALAALDWDVERVDLEGAEELLLYTDGIEEALGDAERIAGWVVASGRTGADLLDAILAACREAAGGRPERDDVTLVSVRW